MNGLGIEEALSETLSPAPILGGMAFTCINRGEPGIVNHLKYGALQVVAAVVVISTTTTTIIKIIMTIITRIAVVRGARARAGREDRARRAGGA